MKRYRFTKHQFIDGVYYTHGIITVPDDFVPNAGMELIEEPKPAEPKNEAEDTASPTE